MIKLYVMNIFSNFSRKKFFLDPVSFNFAPSLLYICRFSLALVSVALLVRRQSRNHKVGSSNPTLGTIGKSV